MEYIALDSHKRYSFASVEEHKGPYSEKPASITDVEPSQSFSPRGSQEPQLPLRRPATGTGSWTRSKRRG